jgi:hypothetical protein
MNRSNYGKLPCLGTTHLVFADGALPHYRQDLVHLQPQLITQSVNLFINILNQQQFRMENSITKGAKTVEGEKLQYTA